jgi:hypothetical protein
MFWFHDFPGATPVTIDRLIALLAVAVVAIYAGPVVAQDVLPAPVRDQPAASPKLPPFPQGGAAPLIAGGLGTPPLTTGRSEECANDYKLLREEAEKRGKLIKAASERKAPPDEACKLIVSFGEAQIRMIKHVESNAAKCGIQQQIADQLLAAYKNTDALLQKVCSVAQKQRWSPGDPVHINDIGDPVMEDEELRRE